MILHSKFLMCLDSTFPKFHPVLLPTRPIQYPVLLVTGVTGVGRQYKPGPGRGCRRPSGKPERKPPHRPDPRPGHVDTWAIMEASVAILLLFAGTLWD